MVYKEINGSFSFNTIVPADGHADVPIDASWILLLWNIHSMVPSGSLKTKRSFHQVLLGH